MHLNVCEAIKIGFSFIECFLFRMCGTSVVPEVSVASQRVCVLGGASLCRCFCGTGTKPIRTQSYFLPGRAELFLPLLLGRGQVLGFCKAPKADECMELHFHPFCF